MRHRTEYLLTQEDGLRRSRCRAESGQGLLEVSLLVPILVLVLVAVVDFGRIFMVRHVITNASREGARLAVLGDQDSSVVRAEVERYLSGAGLDPDKAYITISGLNASTGQPVLVTVDYSVNSLVLKMVHQGDSINMDATSTMLHE